MAYRTREGRFAGVDPLLAERHDKRGHIGLCTVTAAALLPGYAHDRGGMP
ncbi:hypothetical protein G3I76_39570 [Streptomyces sp. SID11233]|nr:hypothetical protein [Streptomyces sp. SID11233]